eukprot:GFYU01007279.1.p1 GENE.GFYU01007279.1~~GFYU01007279.1.p1  ORF type:complete len:149 (-),score=60.78 GFYU01007279.1:439-885(-)
MVVTRKHPFSDDVSAENDFTIMEKISTAETVDIPDFVPPALGDMLRRMLDRDPETRATIDDILQHEWMCEKLPLKDVDYGMLQQFVNSATNLSTFLTSVSSMYQDEHVSVPSGAPSDAPAKADVGAAGGGGGSTAGGGGTGEKQCQVM